MKAICDSKLNCSERQRICLVKLVLTGRRLHTNHQVQLTIFLKVVPFMCKYVKTPWIMDLWIGHGQMPEVHLIVNKRTNVRRQKED